MSGSPTELLFSNRLKWLVGSDDVQPDADGLVSVPGYNRAGRPVSEIAMLEKAAEYGAQAVFFEAGSDGENGSAQAFVFVDAGARFSRRDDIIPFREHPQHNSSPTPPSI